MKKPLKHGWVVALLGSTLIIKKYKTSFCPQNLRLKGKVAKQITHPLYQRHAKYRRWDPSHLLVCVLVCCSECLASLVN